MTERRILPSRRFAETFDLVHADQRYQVTTGHHPDDPTPAEVFIAGAKVGTDLESVARDGAVLISIALQFGVPLLVMRDAITRNPNGTPMTVVGAVLEELNGRNELARLAAADMGRPELAADQGSGADREAHERGAAPPGPA
jgi:hypothetical protein